MRKVTFSLAILLLVSACGKNDNFRTTGYYNPTVPQVPYTPYVAPPSMPPQYYNPGYQQPVQWQVPPNQPQQFAPFAPMYHYMQQNYQMQMYWQSLWYQWSRYCNQQQIYIYDFDTFWNDFCPQQWSGYSNYQQLYVWFDNNVYTPGGYGYCQYCW